MRKRHEHQSVSCRPQRWTRERVGGHALTLEDWRVLLDFCRNRFRGEKAKSNWHVRSGEEPALKRSWNAPAVEGALPTQKESMFTFTPEKVRELKERLNSKWVFGEAGLETGMDQFVRFLLRKAEEPQP